MLNGKPILWSFLLTITLNNPAWALEQAKTPTGLTPAWTLSEGLAQPESVKYDAKRSRLYVSNIQGNPSEKDGKGSISIVSLEGQLLNKAWVTAGLNAPKGMAIVADTLYVADIDGLVAIDLNQGKVIKRYDAKDAKFLNDVTADSAGNVYVSDTFVDRIYCLCDGKFDLWLHTADLMSPNGLFAEDHRLLVAGWGIRTEGFTTTTLGHLKAVTYNDKKITSVGDGKPLGNLDGLEADGKDGYYVTDWMAGKLFHLDVTGKAAELMHLKQGAADLAYLVEKKLLVIPMMNDNELRAFKKTAD
jgi:sugar lactone lactonase YvrE